MAGVQVLTNLYYERHLYVYDLVATAGARSRGHGAALMEHVESLARREGCKHVALACGSGGARCASTSGSASRGRDTPCVKPCFEMRRSDLPGTSREGSAFSGSSRARRSSPRTRASPSGGFWVLVAIAVVTGGTRSGRAPSVPPRTPRTPSMPPTTVPTRPARPPGPRASRRRRWSSSSRARSPCAGGPLRARVAYPARARPAAGVARTDLVLLYPRRVGVPLLRVVHPPTSLFSVPTKLSRCESLTNLHCRLVWSSISTSSLRRSTSTTSSSSTTLLRRRISSLSTTRLETTTSSS